MIDRILNFLKFCHPCQQLIHFVVGIFLIIVLVFFELVDLVGQTVDIVVELIGHVRYFLFHCHALIVDCPFFSCDTVWQRIQNC